MKITHYSNSFVSVRSQDYHIVCDPWIGKANTGGWQSFPEFSVDQLASQLTDANWIYISHLHDDHFHPETLKILGLLDREFIIKRFQTPILRERLKRLGITRIHEVDPFTVNRFGPFEVTIFPQMTSNSSALEDDVNYDLDTSIAIKADGYVFFNQVDNPLSLKDLALIRDYVVDHLGPIEISCIMSGAASEYPHLFLDINQIGEKHRIVERSLHDLGDWLRLLKPNYYFPAGGTYLIPGCLGIFNENIAQPDFTAISKYINSQGLPVQALHLEGGNFLELYEDQNIVRKGSDLTPSENNRENAIALHRQDRYDYENLEAPAWTALVNMLDTAHDNWVQKVSKAALKINQTLRFEIYRQLSAESGIPSSSELLGRYQLTKHSQVDAGSLIIHIDHRALFGCLTRHFVWNGVLGSLCLYERNPNIHYPTDLFSLNYLTLNSKDLERNFWA